MKRPVDEPQAEGAARRDRSFSGLPRPSRRLAALTSSALALPGISGSARAETPIEQRRGSVAYSYYKEDNLSPNKFAAGTGSSERYEVNTMQLRFDLPASERMDVGIGFVYEEMSGASPWFISPGPAGEPLQVMSGATIEDTRYDLNLDADYYLDSGKDTFSAGFSKENDYLSIHGGIASDRNYNDKNTTVSLSGAFSYDWIDPTDPRSTTPNRRSGEKWSIDLFGGLSQILSRSTTGQITVNYKHSDGFLDDPYKAIQSFDQSGLRSDARPGEKDQVSILARLRHHIQALDASVHVDYRFYADTYKVTSHTLELAWYQSILDLVTITPSIRYYSQSKAEFYDTFLPIGVIPKNRSSDFRLSPYGALSFRLKGELELEDLFGKVDLIAGISYERYLSDGNFALVSVNEREEAPGLVRFQVIAATLTGRF